MPVPEPIDHILEHLLPLAVPVSDLTRYHRNPRQGDVAAVAESLRINGQYKPIVVNKGTLTGRPNEILAGNHTYEGVVRLGWEQVAVTWLDVDDDAAARIVVVDNRTSDLAGYDSALLADILSELPALDGTGYDQDDLDELLDAVDIPSSLASETTGNEGEKTSDEHLQWGYVQWGTTRVQITKTEVERLDAVHNAFYERQGTDTGFAHYLLDAHEAEEQASA